MRRWIATLIIFLASHAFAEDWPRWRGPRGDGTWHGPKLPDKWPDGGLKPKWKVPIGGGYSGVTVVGKQVFVMDHQKEPELERVLCFDADTGQQIWKHEYPVAYGKLDYGNGPRAAPTWHDGKLFTVGALGECRCLDATTGAKVWSANYVSDLKGRLQEWRSRNSNARNLNKRGVEENIAGRFALGCFGNVPLGMESQRWRNRLRLMSVCA